MKVHVKPAVAAKAIKALVTDDGFVYFNKNPGELYAPLFLMNKAGEVSATSLWATLEDVLRQSRGRMTPIYEGDELIIRF